MKVVAIVPAAGKGARLGRNTPKPFVLINKRPLLSITLKVLQDSALIKEIIVVCPQGYQDRIKTEIVKRYKITKVSQCIEGGVSRQESVYKALLSLQNKDYDLILIHDGARPFLTKEIIKRACRGALKFSACIVGVPVKDTIKEVELGCITRTLKRNALWQIQTPQVFKKDLILKAYKRFYHKDNFNDDASLVEKLNVKVRIIVGSYYNIKITTPDDLILAQKIYKIINGK